MSQPPPPSGPLSPEERSLRRLIALALLFSPTMCVLPVLAFVAGGSGLRWVIWGLWAIIGVVLITVIWRAAARLRALAAERTR
jgi:hypothetical protein